MDQPRKEIADNLIVNFDKELFRYNIHKQLEDVRIREEYSVFFFHENVDQDILFNIILHRFPQNASMKDLKTFVRVVIEY